MDDFFDEYADILEEKPPRDRYGRPMLVPRGLEPVDANRVPYTRASSLADKIADFSFLHKWRMRYLARGMGLRYDLALLASAEQYTTGFERSPDKAVMRANSDSGRRLDDIIDRALDHVKISEGADYGTAVHAFTEPGANHPPERIANQPDHPNWNPTDDVASFYELRERLGIKGLATEVFTACDEIRTAGTFDHLDYVPGYGIIATDKKTSKEIHGCDFRVQVSVYSHGDVYDVETDQRQTLEEYVASLGYDPALINRDVGIIYWIKGGKTEPHFIDLRLGWEAAKRAAWIRDNHKGKGHRLVEADISKAAARVQEVVLAKIEVADSEEALWEVYRQHKLDWTPTTKAAATARKQAL